MSEVPETKRPLNGGTVERIVSIILLLGGAAGVYAALSAQVSSTRTALDDLRLSFVQWQDQLQKWEGTEQDYDREVRSRLDRMSDRINSKCHDDHDDLPP